MLENGALDAKVCHVCDCAQGSHQIADVSPRDGSPWKGARSFKTEVTGLGIRVVDGAFATAAALADSCLAASRLHCLRLLC